MTAENAKTATAIAVVVFVLLLIGVALSVSQRQGVLATPYVLPPLTKEYTNEQFHFSLMMPEDFSVGVLPVVDGVNTFILQNTKGEGAQIVISEAAPEDRVLTVEKIQADIPDLAIRDAEVLEVGDAYQGVAFRSDNEAFGGDSREVWFYFNGHLYQISTYAKLDTLLKALFATWKFF